MSNQIIKENFTMIKHLTNIFDLFEELGLSINDKTGGFFEDSDVKILYDKSALNHYIRYADGNEVVMLDGDLFLKSLKETEKNFNINFFVNA